MNWSSRNCQIYTPCLYWILWLHCKSRWLLFNANSAIFHLYHDEKKLIFNKMMMSCKQLKKNTCDTCTCRVHYIWWHMYVSCALYLMTHVRVVCTIFDDTCTCRVHYIWWHMYVSCALYLMTHVRVVCTIFDDTCTCRVHYIWWHMHLSYINGSYLELPIDPLCKEHHILWCLTPLSTIDLKQISHITQKYGRCFLHDVFKYILKLFFYNQICPCGYLF